LASNQAQALIKKQSSAPASNQAPTHYFIFLFFIFRRGSLTTWDGAWERSDPGWSNRSGQTIMY
jgi:hypothetical protein